MKTKTVPVIIMLIAGAVACVLGLINRYDTTSFFRMVFVVLVVFYILGCIIKLILDKNFPIEEESADESEDSEEKENIESDNEAKNDE